MSIVSTNSGGPTQQQYGVKMSSRERGAKVHLSNQNNNKISNVYSSGKRQMGGLSVARQH